MPIPHAEAAFIPPEKLSEYLLNPGHPIGGPKARWFLEHGYDPHDSQRLAADLLGLVCISSDFVDEATQLGVKYIVRGQLHAPDGSLANVVTVWIAETDPPAPRFVTAYPDKR